MKCHSKEWMKEDVSLEDGVLPPQGPMAQQNSPPLTVLARTHSPLLVTSHWKVSSQSGYANKSQVLLAKKQVMVAILMQYVSMCEHEELTAESFILQNSPDRMQWLYTFPSPATKRLTSFRTSFMHVSNQ
jgi:hypothetical protein